MNYYERHIGDYLKDTAHLSLLEHGVYTRLLDVYYTREAPLPAADVARLIGARTRDEKAALDVVLAEFFQLDGDAYLQTRCDREIARLQDKRSKASASANARWSKREPQSDGNANASADAMRTHSEGNARAPVPRHQTPDTKEKNPPASRVPPAAAGPRPAKKCPASFEITSELVDWAKQHAPGVSVSTETAKMRDHTFATARTDWPGTWRNWMRKAYEGRSGAAAPTFRERDAAATAEKVRQMTGGLLDPNKPTGEVFDVTPRLVG